MVLSLLHYIRCFIYMHVMLYMTAVYMNISKITDLYLVNQFLLSLGFLFVCFLLFVSRKKEKN